MKVLVIPDIHLKPDIIDMARHILESGQADFACFLGDLLDDWGEEYNIGLYGRTLKRCLEFEKDFPNTLWCMGNHDFGYYYPKWGRRHTGHSEFCEDEVSVYLREFKRKGINQKVVHQVDNALFSHAAITKAWLNRNMEKGQSVIGTCNNATAEQLWEQDSPIWSRTLDGSTELYGEKQFLQVVGHTPVKKIEQKQNVLYTDVFSTYSDGVPYGERRFTVVDTEDKTWRYAEEQKCI